MREISDLIVRMALENGEPAAHGGSRHGRRRIEGERNRTGAGARQAYPLVTFLNAHWNVFSASDFFSMA
jgi:hypothetical protein